MNFYIRLLSYTEACKIVEFINNIVGCYANITTGGVSVQHGDRIDKDMVTHELNLHYPRWEITEDPPHEVNKRICKSLR